ncbi:MAG: photosynthetic reaction center cytochrome c subunit [Chloroflexia bacterium]|nr:photosynthetic reaction center cytochrome c subunit [Chloroflexia bacterium]
MSQQQLAFPPLNDDAKFNLVAGAIAAITMVLSIVAFWWIWWIVQPPAPKPIPESTIYRMYDPSGNHLKPESLAAMQKYIKEHEQPQNVQVLKGWNTKQISNYMVSQVAGGLKVDCSYCHNINNFADYSNPNKIKAKAMLLMSGDLNRSYVSKLPTSVGGYNITCATCHNGKPKFETYPIQIQNTLPNDYRLPLDREYPGGLVITGVKSKSLDEVELNQNTMYHMNLSLGQGCTFCHNARYFPATGVKDGGRDQKQHATWMLQMAKHINANYSTIMANQTPSCWMCHQGYTVPPGAAKAGQVPDVLSTTSSAP